MGKSMKLGGGGRFAALAKKTGSKALAAYIGRKKYGAKKMAQMSANGKKKYRKGTPGKVAPKQAKTGIATNIPSRSTLVRGGKAGRPNPSIYNI